MSLANLEKTIAEGAFGAGEITQKVMEVLKSSSGIYELYDKVMFAYKETLGRSGIGSKVSEVDGAGLKYWMQYLYSNGITQQKEISDTLASAGWDHVLKNPSDAYSQYVRPYLEKYLGEIPSFALGGQHSGGLRLVGEEGPELELTGPAQYFSFDKTKKLFEPNASTNKSKDELVAEVRKLNQQVVELQQVIIDGAVLNAEATNKNTVAISGTIKTSMSVNTHSMNIARKVASS